MDKKAKIPMREDKMRIPSSIEQVLFYHCSTDMPNTK